MSKLIFLSIQEKFTLNFKWQILNQTDYDFLFQNQSMSTIKLQNFWEFLSQKNSLKTFFLIIG
jgi:hypothetical protein